MERELRAGKLINVLWHLSPNSEVTATDRAAKVGALTR